MKSILSRTGTIIMILGIQLSCFRLFDEETVIEYSISNLSSHEILVEYSTIESEGIESLMLLDNSGDQLLRYVLDGLQEKPNSDEFSKYLMYLNIYLNDTLKYNQNPTDKEKWVLTRDTFDDEVNYYSYGFYFTDSLLLKDESP